MASPTSYIQGHHESVTRTHAVRTAEDSAAFLLPHLRGDMRILDVGCGPGSISCSLCKYVPKGLVIGVDVTETVLDQGRFLGKDLKNISFQVANVVEGLPFPDEHFDIVYCHQVLIHISMPITALREMRRVCKVGGLVACREGDWGTVVFHPLNSGLQLLLQVYERMLRSDGNEPHAGRQLHVWAKHAGLDPRRIQKGASTSSHSMEEDRQWYGKTHVERWKKSDLRSKAKTSGVTDEQLAEMISGLEQWMNDEDGWMAILHAEIICTR